MTLVQKGYPKEAHRPTKRGPLFTHQNQKTRDKHNYRQTTKENKEILGKTRKKNHKEDGKNGKQFLHKHNENIQENRSIHINHHWLEQCIF